MKTFSIIASLLALSVAPVFAGANATGKARTQQSDSEIEDIGEVTEDGEGVGPGGGKFRAQASARAEYTSNAKLSGSHSSSDVLWMPALEFGYGTPLGRGFSIDVAAKIDSVFYSDHGERAIIGYSAPVTLDWRPNPNAPRAYITFEPYRYDSFDNGDLVTQALALGGGTDWGFGFNGGRSLFFVGYSFMQYWSDPESDTRHTHRAVIGMSHQFSPKLLGQFFYAYQYSVFSDADRDDSRHIVGANLTYQFNRSLFGTVSAAFVDNNSSDVRSDYQSLNGSVGLTWQF